jgi:nucleoside-diphosphate-sugar epimerase
MKVLILGTGYSGTALATELSKEHEVFTTSRQGSPLIEFELTREETWENLPKVDYTFWTFPAQPIDSINSFLEKKKEELGLIIVIGSTGSYITGEDHQVISEASSLDLESERVKGEELIRKAGGMVVRASGIYGPERNPLNWVKSGRVGPSKKLLNLIHVEDLVVVLWKAASMGKACSNYIASSKSSIPWDELILRLQNDFEFETPTDCPSSKKPSKDVDASQTLKELGIQLKYPSILEGIVQLNKSI